VLIDYLDASAANHDNLHHMPPPCANELLENYVGCVCIDVRSRLSCMMCPGSTIYQASTHVVVIYIPGCGFEANRFFSLFSFFSFFSFSRPWCVGVWLKLNVASCVRLPV